MTGKQVAASTRVAPSRTCKRPASRVFASYPKSDNAAREKAGKRREDRHHAQEREPSEQYDGRCKSQSVQKLCHPGWCVGRKTGVRAHRHIINEADDQPERRVSKHRLEGRLDEFGAAVHGSPT